MVSNIVEIEDFIENPTNLSKYLLEIVTKKKRKYDYFLKSNNFIIHTSNSIKLRIWYLNKYHEIYRFIKTFKIKEKKICGLFNEFSNISDFIALNNLLLMYAYLTEKNKSSSIITKEDEKLLLFKELYNGNISAKKFKEKYGHYALNAFELSSKRFNEYKYNQLMNLAKFLKNFKLKKKITVNECINSKNNNLFSIYSALREELKYISLQIISRLRYKLLKLEKEKNIDNIFDLTYKELGNLIS